MVPGRTERNARLQSGYHHHRYQHSVCYRPDDLPVARQWSHNTLKTKLSHCAYYVTGTHNPLHSYILVLAYLGFPEDWLLNVCSRANNVNGATYFFSRTGMNIWGL